MTDVRVTTDDKRALDLLLKWLKTPGQKNLYDLNRFRDAMGMENDAAARQLARLERLGVIDVTAPLNGFPFVFRIDVAIEDLIADIEDHQQAQANPPRPDLVEKAKNWVRSNPWTAWPIIVLLGLFVLVPFLNQCWELLQKIGLVAK